MSDISVESQELPVLVFPKATSLGEVMSGPHTNLEADWFGESLPRTRFAVAIDGSRLYFSAQCDQSPDSPQAHTLGSFVEGLYNHDVAEIFLAEDGTGKYQEFNLGPRGAWWSALFSDYRVRDEANFVMPQSVALHSEVDGNHWHAGLSLPLSELSISFNGDTQSRANVTFIVGGADKQFASWADLKKSQPDFHPAQHFERLKLVPIEDLR